MKAFPCFKQAERLLGSSSWQQKGQRNASPCLQLCLTACDNAWPYVSYSFTEHVAKEFVVVTKDKSCVQHNITQDHRSTRVQDAEIYCGRTHVCAHTTHDMAVAPCLLAACHARSMVAFRVALASRHRCSAHIGRLWRSPSVASLLVGMSLIELRISATSPLT